ncbi:MAG: hypothetical protein SXG53_22870 [Pseudomonadota bacterium]|nr:hypothetical protein [Pseudomonadota bacterium]
MRYAISVGTNPMLYGPWQWFEQNIPVQSNPARVSACTAFIAQHAQTVAEQLYPPTPTVTNPRYDTVVSTPTECSFVARATYMPSGAIVGTTAVAQLNAQYGTVCEPEPDQCEVDAPDESFQVTGPVPAESCNPITKCKNVFHSPVCTGASCVYTQTQTNENCGPSAPEEEEPPPPGEACTASGEVQFCRGNEDEDENCGFLNGEFICLDQTEDDGCQVMGDGSRVCGPQAPTPPVPDNGTPGQPAEPDEVIQTPDNTFNYYNNNTVNNSARPPGSSGDNPYDGDDDGSGDKEPGAGGGTGSGDGEGDDEGCTEDDGCTGTLPVLEPIICETFGGCLSAYWTRLNTAPLVQAVTNVGSAMPSGSCPAVNISMFGETSSLSAPMCDIWSATIAPILGAVFLLFYAWVSTRIVLSA